MHSKTYSEKMKYPIVFFPAFTCLQATIKGLTINIGAMAMYNKKVCRYLNIK